MDPDQCLIDIANRSPPVPARTCGQKQMVEAARKEHGGKAKSTKKKPAAAAQLRSESAAPVKTPTKTPTKKAQQKHSPCGKSPATPTKPLSTSSCRDLKNLHSKMYHRTLKHALGRGLDGDAAKAEARLEANKAKDEFIKARSS